MKIIILLALAAIPVLGQDRNAFPLSARVTAIGSISGAIPVYTGGVISSIPTSGRTVDLTIDKITYTVICKHKEITLNETLSAKLEEHKVDVLTPDGKVLKLRIVAVKEEATLPVAAAPAETVVKKSEPEEQAKDRAKTGEETGTVVVGSAPDGAEVYVDGNLVGGVPATLRLTPGKHTIRVVLNGYKDWSRALSVLASSEVKLTATLEKEN